MSVNPITSQQSPPPSSLPSPLNCERTAIGHMQQRCLTKPVATASIMCIQTSHTTPCPSLAQYLLHAHVSQSSYTDTIVATDVNTATYTGTTAVVVVALAICTNVNRRRMDGWQHMYAAAVPQRQYFAFSLQWRIALQSSAHLSRSECNVHVKHVHVDGQCRRTAASNCWSPPALVPAPVLPLHHPDMPVDCVWGGRVDLSCV